MGARIKIITSQNINSYCCRKAEGDKKKNVQQILTDEEHKYVSFFSKILNFKSSVSLFFRIFLKNFIYQADGGISGEEVYSRVKDMTSRC